MRKNRIVERQLPCGLMEFDCFSFSARSAYVNFSSFGTEMVFVML